MNESLGAGILVATPLMLEGAPPSSGPFGAVQGDSSTKPSVAAPTSAQKSFFAGIPQHGTVLGSPDAPVTLLAADALSAVVALAAWLRLRHTLT